MVTFMNPNYAKLQPGLKVIDLRNFKLLPFSKIKLIWKNNCNSFRSSSNLSSRFIVSWKVSLNSSSSGSCVLSCFSVKTTSSRNLSALFFRTRSKLTVIFWFHILCWIASSNVSACVRWDCESGLKMPRFFPKIKHIFLLYKWLFAVSVYGVDDNKDSVDRSDSDGGDWTIDRITQLDERRAVNREAVSSIPSRATTQDIHWAESANLVSKFGL